MAAEGGNNITWFTYTGVEDIPDDVTHVFVNVKTIPARAFYRHASIVEVICHDKVEEIEEEAFFNCPRLRRVIMPGVKLVVAWVFCDCHALTDVQCGKLEMIEEWAFCACNSLRSINLSSIRIVGDGAFNNCKVLTDVKIGNKLESCFGEVAFGICPSLERITIPLKDGMITDDNIFAGDTNLNHVDLFEAEELRETVAALHFEEWRNDMSAEIDSINQILHNADAGRWREDDIGGYDNGEKAQVIREWIRSVRRKIIHYKAEHQGILDEAATTLLQLALPRDIVMNNVLSFLELPQHRFGVKDREDGS